MPNQRSKSTNFDTTQELILMRMSIKAIRDRMNEDLDAMAEQINRLLPPEDDTRYQRRKHWGKKEWGLFLKGKIT